VDFDAIDARAGADAEVQARLVFGRFRSIFKTKVHFSGNQTDFDEYCMLSEQS